MNLFDPEVISTIVVALFGVGAGGHQLGKRNGTHPVSREDFEKLKTWIKDELEPLQDFVKYAKWREKYEAEMEEKKSSAAPRRVPADDVA